MSFVLVPNGATPTAYDVNAIIQALEGIANAGQPISMTALSDAASYALDLRNLGTGGLGLRVKDSAGNTLLTVNDTGLTAKTMYVNGTAGAGFIDFVGQASNPDAPAAGSTRFHAATTQGFTRFEQDNEATTNLVLGRDNVIIARNTSGSDIVKGRAVYVSGSTGNVPNIALARADSLTTLPAIGVTLDAIANNAYGQVMKLGVIGSVDTSAFSSGDRLFVSAATAGVFTATRPVYPNFAQRIGSVLVSGVGNGSLSISMAPFLGGEETGTAGDFTVGGTLTSALLQASLSTDGVSALGKFLNPSTHTDARAEIYIGKTVADNDCIAMGYRQDGNYAYMQLYGDAEGNGLVIQDGGIIRTGSGTKIGADSTNNLLDDASTGAGTVTLYIGNASINVTSDSRLKENIVDTARDAMALIRQLRVVDYTWNDPTDTAPVNRNSRGTWMGLVAQEAVDIVPWTVNAPDRTCAVCRAGQPCEDHPSFWQLQYEQLGGLFAKALQQIDARLAALETK